MGLEQPNKICPNRRARFVGKLLLESDLAIIYFRALFLLRFLPYWGKSFLNGSSLTHLLGHDSFGRAISCLISCLTRQCSTCCLSSETPKPRRHFCPVTRSATPNTLPIKLTPGLNHLNATPTPSPPTSKLRTRSHLDRTQDTKVFFSFFPLLQTLLDTYHTNTTTKQPVQGKIDSHSNLEPSLLVYST